MHAMASATRRGIVVRQLLNDQLKRTRSSPLQPAQSPSENSVIFVCTSLEPWKLTTCVFHDKLGRCLYCKLFGSPYDSFIYVLS